MTANLQGGGSVIADHHLAMLAASGITDEYAMARGYETITDPKRLAELKIVKAARNCVPGLLVPQLRVEGSTWGYQYRPDNPRLREGKPVKYETPWEQRNGLDVPPGVASMLADPAVPLWVTEGVKKADCGAINGLCIVALSGVWCWLYTNSAGGKMALPEWRDIALNGRRVIMAFDGDVARQPAVRKALHALAAYLATKGAKVEYLHLPDTDDKTGLDDFLVEHPVEELRRLVKPTPPPIANREPPKPVEAPKPEPVKPVSLDELHTRFLYWFGEYYDLDAIDVSLCVVAVERLSGDPLWVLIVSGSGMTKSETVVPIARCDGAVMVSTITGEGALLSMTSNKDRTVESTGGLLRELGDRGILVLKDVTTILSMSGDRRDAVLAALREIFDGRWDRRAGVDGGVVATWTGRIAVLGAVTTAWDTAHAVIAKCGDRFVLLRVDSTRERMAVAESSLKAIGHEAQMREELAQLAAGVVAGVDPDVEILLTSDEESMLIEAADLVTRCRTGVERDYQSNPVMAHMLEAPTRFVKQLAQVMRGAIAIGHGRGDALRLALRVARDSMPPLRLRIINYLAKEPRSTTTQVRKALQEPHNTVDRELQSLQLLGAVSCHEEPQYNKLGDELKPKWLWLLAEQIDPEVLSFPSSAYPAYTGEVSKGSKGSKGDPLYTYPYVRGAEFGSGSEGALNFSIYGDGRCEKCGFHVATQGHRDGCAALA
jgi:hypothetical protein